jgi:hypothetical protein
MDSTPAKLDANLKIIQSLIDDCLEEGEFDEAFLLFIKFGKTLNNEHREYLFDRYYKMLHLDCAENFDNK